MENKHSTVSEKISSKNLQHHEVGNFSGIEIPFNHQTSDA